MDTDAAAWAEYNRLNQKTFSQRAGHFAADAVLNQDARADAWRELSNPDFSSGWGVATFAVAGVSYGANTIDAAANAIPLIGTAKGLIETGVKAGIKTVAGVFAKDTAKEFAEIGSKEIGQVAKRLEQQEFKFTEPVSGPYDNIANPKTVGSGQDFTAAQKKAYYEANMERNGGVIRDDVTGQVLDYPQKSRAGVTPSPNEAQVDHYFPKSEGGMNSSANARIRSREANRAKSNTTPW